MTALVFVALFGASTVPEPAVVPRPQKLEALAGTGFEISKGTVVLARGESPSIKFLTDLVARCTGVATEVVGEAPRTAGTPVISLQEARDLPSEGYRLFAQGTDMMVSYGGDAGLFYAVQTLRQLLPAEIELAESPSSVRWTVPAVRIEDWPRFSWRGMHLDVSRHFFPVPFIKKYIDFIAMNKMNVFHWHLVDDGGWRMEVDKYPRLTSVGAWRVDTGGEWPGGNWNYGALRFIVGEGQGKRYGGFYTKEQMRDIVSYAAERQVTVVPEIEMPGHNLPALVAYPELGCDGVAPLAEKGGSATNVFCAGKESTFAFLEQVLLETMELFQSPFIHIGADEVWKGHWQNCASCQARIKSEGLKDENELQSYFVRRIEKFLVSHRRRLVGWDEILEGGLAPEATVMSWRGEAGGIEAAKAGHDVVMSPTSHCYFDYSYQTTPTKHVYAWEPSPISLTPEQAKHVLGGQANVWTEFIPTEERAEYMVFPRMLATAEALWTNNSRRDWDSFSSRSMRQFGRLDAMGVNYQIPAPEVEFTAAVFSKTASVAARAADGTPFTLRYTTDGSAPGAESPAYRGPLTVDRSQTVSFALVSKRGTVGDVTRVECVKSAPVAADSLIDFLHVDVYEGQWTRVPDFTKLNPVKSMDVKTIDLGPRTRDEGFGLRFSGFFVVETEGVYRFRLGSDDGSYLKIAGAKVVDNDGLHGYVQREGAVRLVPGAFPVEIGFFEAGGAERLTLEIQAPGAAWSTAVSGMFKKHR